MCEMLAREKKNIARNAVRSKETMLSALIVQHWSLSVIALKHQYIAARYDQQRGSSDSRGYDSKRRRFRLDYLRRNPLCLDCLDQDRVTAATEPHHLIKLKIEPDRKYNETNLRPLCHECHSIRTARGG